VIVATGAAYRRIPSENLQRLEGAGVFFTVPHESRVLEGQDVFICGGGNSGGQAAAHMARHARSVTILCRGRSLADTMSEYLITLLEHMPNVFVRPRHEVIDGAGEHALEHIVVRDLDSGETTTLPTQFLFVMIGCDPRTAWLAGTLQRDDRGYICTGPDVDLALGWPADRPPMGQETSIPGVFASGDTRLGSVKRLSAAVGEGASAVQEVHHYLAAPVEVDVNVDVDVNVADPAARDARGLEAEAPEPALT
jgi:thioredoxin reductase (NADPH)